MTRRDKTINNYPVYCAAPPPHIIMWCEGFGYLWWLLQRTFLLEGVSNQIVQKVCSNECAIYSFFLRKAYYCIPVVKFLHTGCQITASEC